MPRNLNDNHSRPHVSIPVGTRQSQGDRYAFTPAYAFEVTPPPYHNSDSLVNPWEDQPSTPETARPRVQSMVELTGRPPSRTTSATVTRSNHLAFPEPQIYRSTSARPAGQPTNTLAHRHSRSDLGLHSATSTASFLSEASSYLNQGEDSDHYEYGSERDHDTEDLSHELSNISLDSEEGLRRFQAGELPESEREWHRLVPPEAMEALGKQEVQRQSVLFEVFKAEKDYVSDLQAVEEVFIRGLRNSSPPIFQQSRLSSFINEVFGNINQILAHHQRMLGALFERQRDQHPLIQSVADIILDTALMSDFRSSYEDYIKHYPLAESYHRSELKKNPAYQSFLQSVSTDPRVRKRDLITFLSRPVTRLPRLNLLLEHILKLTDKDHSDIEVLPIILGILGDFIKSTQPGIEAAESQVKFWALSESLVFQKGEIIDMDLYDKSRTLVYSGPLSRRSRTDSGWSESWIDLTGALLDHYFLLTREEKRSNGTIKRHLMSRPLPLSYLRLGSFNSPPELRKERVDDGRLLDSLRSQYISIYPFTIYHASNKSTRRYTLYVASESIRKRWYSAFVDAIGVHKVRQEANMWFYSHTLTDRYFRVMGPKVEYNSSAKMSGRITSAVPFSSDDRKFIIVGCSTGIYASSKGLDEFRKIFTYSSPISMAAIQPNGSKKFAKLVIHSETSLVSYSLDALVRVVLGEVQPSALAATMEKIPGQDGHVVFFKHVHIGDRALIIYASKRLLQVSLTLQVLEVAHTSLTPLSPRRSPPSTPSFRSFGEPGYVPKDAHNITPLAKTVGICARDGIVIIDPTNLTNSAVTIVPDLRDAATNPPMANLKSRLDGAKPLGLARVNPSELLVVYDVVGCYITKHGTPGRSSGYIKWETQATSFAQRGNHIMLFSPSFIEIRNITTGRIVQVIEGVDIRLLHTGPTYGEDDNVLVAMRGSKNDKDGVSEMIIELVETSEIVATPAIPLPAVPAMWDEWDM